MTEKKKAAPAKPDAASKNSFHLNHSSRSRMKAFIVRLASHGWIPLALANWLIQRGGLTHD